MKLGLASGLVHNSAKEWAENLRALGCKFVLFPLSYTEDENKIADYVDAAKAKRLQIAEVGIWNNVLAKDSNEREKARARAEGQLRLADAIGARCTVNVAGTLGGPVWDGAYSLNYSREAWEAVVIYVQDLLDKVKPQHTSFSIEPMPYMVPTSPDEYLKLIQDVDREAFKVHLDLVNMVNSPERYFFLDEFMEECFTKLSDHIVSCHLKDVLLLQELTVHIVEKAPGEGSLNIPRYFELMKTCHEDTPVIIEHLHSDEEYIRALQFVQSQIGKVM